MKNFHPDTLLARGELAHRLLLSYTRMESEHYRPDHIFGADQAGWPGDWEGRTMLALVRLAQSSHREPAYLERMLDRLSDKLNEKGYLGPLMPAGEFNEQQFSGHNWLLRALMEYTLWKNDERFVPIIRAIISNLYLPALGHYREYPTIVQDSQEGGYAGEIKGRYKCWHLSSDIGCAFICIDALAQAYGDFGITDLEPLLREMIDVYSGLNFVGLSVQTHATLSALRGVLRFYSATGERQFLETAERVFSLYQQFGMTENYANMNWFGRPKWTEPCAIADSLICAIELFKATKKAEYLELAHKIYYNAFCHAQLPNGGFGCDICSGYPEPFIRHSGKDVCEAYWCCTMRGGATLGYFAQQQFISAEDNSLYLLHHTDAIFHNGNISIRETTDYPLSGNIVLCTENASEQSVLLMVFIPSYAVDNIQCCVDGISLPAKLMAGFLQLPIESGMHKIEIDFPIPLLENSSIHHASGAGVTLSHGLLLLGTQTEKILSYPDTDSLEQISPGLYQDKSTGQDFGVIADMIDRDMAFATQENRQIIFRKGAN